VRASGEGSDHGGRVGDKRRGGHEWKGVSIEGMGWVNNRDLRHHSLEE
jgi:hypothetical protein